jgi:hypothetical protein
MSNARAGSAIPYSLSIVSGILGVGFCCFFGFGEISSPTIYNLGYILLGIGMLLLVSFGYRGLTEHHKIGNEVWWQLLVVSLIELIFVVLLVAFLFNGLALLSLGGSTIF